MEEVEWERELEKNIKTFCATSSCATAIVVDGTDVRVKNGLVMITGNWKAHAGSVSTEIYDYTNGSVRKGPDMKVARYNHASVTLPTGDVAVFGGFNRKLDTRYLSSYELFNVESHSYSKIGNMLEKRERSAAVLLQTGVVFIVGGVDEFKYLDTCEFYNPENNTFSPSKAKLRCARVGHTASLLPDGRVLVCGGNNNGVWCNTTEIYDPSTDSFSDGPLMTVRRDGHSATALEDGRIIICGGENGLSSTSTELYDPAANSFAAGPRILVGRVEHFSALLQNGKVLIGGGSTNESDRTTEIYDPATNSFSKGSNLLEGRYGASASNF